MIKFIYPTIDLFLYDLREGLGQTDVEIEQNRHQFMQKLPDTLDKTTFIQLDDKYLEPEYVELLGGQRDSHFESDIHEGYYYPVRLSDTYGLLLDCSRKETQPDADLTWLKDLQAYITDKLKAQTGTLGQTWMFSAQLPDVPAQEHKAIAKRCYETLIPGADFSENKTAQNEFLGGSLFEFWRYTGMDTENHHIIIAFYPNETAAKTAALFYPDWLRLLMYRHKMMWAYNQSRVLKQRLKAEAVKIQICNEAVSQHPSLDFKKLQETLRKTWEVLPRYTTDLSGLDDQTRTIEINLDNYQKRLKTLGEKAGQNNLKFDKFSEWVQNKYLRQVQKDHANLSPYLKLL